MAKASANKQPGNPAETNNNPPDKNDIQPLPTSPAEQGNADKGNDITQGPLKPAVDNPIVTDKKVAAKEVAPRPLRKLLEHDLQLAEYAQPWHRITINDADTIVDDIIKPEFWANVGERLKPANGHAFPIVYVFWADGSAFVELVVLDSGPQWAKVKILRNIDMSEEMEFVKKRADGAGDDRFRIEYKGPVVRWAVIRNADEKIMESKLADKGAAQKWLNEYLKALG